MNFNNNKQSLSWYRQHFSSLNAVSEADAIGEYQAVYVGPFWLRIGARLSEPIIGLSGWTGKRIMGDGAATNRVKRSGTVQDYCAMSAAPGISAIDGGDALVFSYSAKSPGLLRFFKDELRQYDDKTILGFAVINLPLLRHMPLPFVLEKIETEG